MCFICEAHRKRSPFIRAAQGYGRRLTSLSKISAERSPDSVPLRRLSSLRAAPPWQLQSQWRRCRWREFFPCTRHAAGERILPGPCLLPSPAVQTLEASFLPGSSRMGGGRSGTAAGSASALTWAPPARGSPSAGASPSPAPSLYAPSHSNYVLLCRFRVTCDFKTCRRFRQVLKLRGQKLELMLLDIAQKQVEIYFTFSQWLSPMAEYVLTFEVCEFTVSALSGRRRTS
jgi:hypothetical protein